MFIQTIPDLQRPLLYVHILTHTRTPALVQRILGWSISPPSNAFLWFSFQHFERAVLRVPGGFQRFERAVLRAFSSSVVLCCASERTVRKVSRFRRARSVLKVSNSFSRSRTNGSKGFPPWPASTRWSNLLGGPMNPVYYLCCTSVTSPDILEAFTLHTGRSKGFSRFREVRNAGK